MTVNEVLEYINSIAPLCDAEDYDNVGLLAGSGETEITGIACALDITNEVIEEAVSKGANLIVSHHPVIFHPLRSIEPQGPAARLIKEGVCAICVHTNFDIAENGVNDTLLELLEFKRAEVLKPTLPDGRGYGAICDLPITFSPRELAEHCRTALDLQTVRFSRYDREINRVAVCCGSGIDDEIMKLACEKRCDAVISGDIDHNYWIEAQNRGMTLVDAGHYGTERYAAHRLAELLTKFYNGVPVFAAESDEDPCLYI